MNPSIGPLKPKFFSIDYTAAGSKTSAMIGFSLSPTASTRVLEIGEKHIFAHWRKRPSFLAFMGQRQIGYFSINVERKSDLELGSNPGLPSGFSLSEAKIGFLVFVPPKKRRFLPPYPAYIQGRVFVSDELHESLRHMLQARKIPTWLRLTLEIEDGALEYGCEPDGSRIIWKVENANERSLLNVTEIHFNLFHWRPLWKSLLGRLASALGE